MRYKKRLLVSLTAAALCGIVIIGNHAKTEVIAETVVSGGMGGGAGATLHDDFTRPNKDVYVENWSGVPIVTRIKLAEYMETGSGAGIKNNAAGKA